MEIDEKPLRRSIRIMNIKSRLIPYKTNFSFINIQKPKKKGPTGSVLKKYYGYQRHCSCCLVGTQKPAKDSLEAALEKLNMGS